MTIVRITATLLAKRWNDGLLINLLIQLMINEKVMNALMSIKGCRDVKEDISVIISIDDIIKKLKAKNNRVEELTPNEKIKLTHERNDFNKKFKEILDKLKSFTNLISLFMYPATNKKNINKLSLK